MKMTASGGSAFPVWRSALATLVVAVFVGLGLIPVLDGVTRVLPTREVAVEIVDREEVARPSGSRAIGGWQKNWRVTVEFEDGSRRTLACGKDLYDEARGAGRSFGQAWLRVSALAGRPVALTVITESLVSVPLLGIEGEGKVEEYPLRLPLSGLLIGGVFCWGLAGWLGWRLRRVAGFHWGVFWVGMAAVICAAGLWWAKSV